MVKNDTGISEVTHKVNEAVCRLMWEGNVDADHLESQTGIPLLCL